MKMDGSIKANNSAAAELHGEQAMGQEADARAARTASALPCLFVTTASEEAKEEARPLPGPRKKQADTLAENIKWLAIIFGQACIGFLTLTVGDVEVGGRYRNLRDRKEAQRRFRSLLTNIIAKRYHCGVTVTERHRNGGLHFHLAVVCADDIHGQIDFAACFPSKDGRGKPQYKPDYATANVALKREWAFWRRIAKWYGFGRHQLQPMRANGEALGRYLAAYLSQDWEHRLPEDKGARCVRYFGHWSTAPRIAGRRPTAPPNDSRFGWMTPRACAWRELVKQTVIVLKFKGAKIYEDNIKDIIGPKWAWKMGKLFESVRFEPAESLAAETRAAILDHNLKVKVRWLLNGGNVNDDCWLHVTEITLDHLRPSPEWEKEMADLKMAKDAEAAINAGLRKLAKQKRELAERQLILDKVVAGGVA